VGILGTTYSGHFEDVKGIDAAVGARAGFGVRLGRAHAWLERGRGNAAADARAGAACGVIGRCSARPGLYERRGLEHDDAAVVYQLLTDYWCFACREAQQGARLGDHDPHRRRERRLHCALPVPGPALARARPPAPHAQRSTLAACLSAMRGQSVCSR